MADSTNTSNTDTSNSSTKDTSSTSGTSSSDSALLAQDQEGFTPGDPIQQPEPIAVPTIEDANGVQRIAGGGIRDAWEPAPVEPSEEDKALAELRLKAEEERNRKANLLASGQLTNDDAKKS